MIGARKGVFALLLVLLAQSVVAIAVPSEWTPVSHRPSPDHTVRCIFALQQQNTDVLEEMFWDRSNPKSSNFGKWLSHEELASIVAPGAVAATAVTEWLEQNGIMDFDVVQTKDAIFVHATVAQMEALLQVEYEAFVHGVSGKTIYRSLLPFSLPEHIQEHIQLIHDVNDFPPLSSRRSSRPAQEALKDKLKSSAPLTITSVNARSQSPSASLEITVSFTCDPHCPSEIYVAATSRNPNIDTFSSTTIDNSTLCDGNSCTVVLVVQYYVPYNVSASTFTNGMLEYAYYPYPVVVTPHVVPQQLWDLYNMPKNPLVTHPNATQCVVEFEQQWYSPEDLDEFFLLMDITNQAPVVVVGPNNATEPGAEANLDIQWIMAMAPGAPTWFWSIAANSTIEIDHILTWCYQVGNYTNPPAVNSLSYGMTEDNVDRFLGSGYLQRTNTELQKLAMQGLTILIADGDVGANDLGAPPMSQVRCWPSHADWPSDCAYVTAVGSTYITPLTERICYVENGADCLENPLGEISVSVDAGMTWTTGGGFSNFTLRPSYQDKAVADYMTIAADFLPPTGYFNTSGRGYADVATVGHNLEIVLSGELRGIDGTSASAPIFAGIVTMLNNARLEANKSTLGFMNQIIYQAYEDIPSAWNDITIGYNRCGGIGWYPVCCPNGYYASSRWDPLSGVGSPNYEVLRNYVLSLP